MAALLTAHLLPLKRDTTMRLVLTFSGAYLLAVAVLDLLPMVYHGGGEHHHNIGLWVMGGYLLQLLLELFSGGVEHGHQHIHDLPKKKMPTALLVALFLHAILECTPIGAMGAGATATSLTVAIALHSFPITIVLYSLLRSIQVSQARSIALIVLFGGMHVLGVVLAGSLGFLRGAEHELTAITLGVFLHVSTTILFESSKGHAFNLIKFASIVAAFALAYFGHELI